MKNKPMIVFAFILFLLPTLACGLGSDTVAEIESAAESVSTVQAEVEQLETMATAQSEVANATPETGPGTSIDNPLDITFDQMVTGQINGNNFERFYRMNLPAGAVLDVTASNGAESGGDIAFRLMTMEGGFPTPIMEQTVPIGMSDQLRFMTGDESGGTYLLVARGGFLGIDEFTFTPSMTMQNDAGSGGDAIAEPTTGTEIGAGTFAGALGGSDKADVYRFNVPARSVVRLSLTNNADSENMLTTLLSTNGNHVRYYNDRNAQPGNELRFAADELEGGIYNLEIKGDTTKEAAYTFTVEITLQNDAASGGDAGDDFSTATPISLNQTVTGLRGEGDKDCYRLATMAEQTINLALDSLTDEFLGGRPIPRLYDAAGNTVGVGGGPNPGSSETVTETAVSAETFLCIEGGGNGALYSFTLSSG